MCRETTNTSQLPIPHPPVEFLNATFTTIFVLFRHFARDLNKRDAVIGRDLDADQDGATPDDGLHRLVKLDVRQI